MQDPCRHRQLIRVHAHGRGVDENRCFGDCRFVPDDDADRLIDRITHHPHEFLGVPAGPVDDHDVRAASCERTGDGTSSPACTENHRALTDEADRTLRFDRVTTSVPVRVVAAQFPVPHGHAVDGIQGACVIVQRIEMRNDGFLQRHGDRQTAETTPAHRRHERAEGIVRDLDSLVPPVDAERRKRRRVNRRRETVRDGTPDDSCPGRHGRIPATLAFSTFARCCS